MARINYVKHAQQRYATVPVLNDDGTQKTTAVMRRGGSPKVTKKGKEVTMRVTVADKTKPLPNLKCGKCGVEIKPGDPYKWVKTKSGPFGGATRYRCASCPSWKLSELSSSKMSGVYAAQEQVDEMIDSCEDVSDLESLRDDAASQIRDVAQEYIDSADNMESGFGHETSMSAELREKGEALEAWAEDIENVSFDEFEEQEFEPGDLTEPGDPPFTTTEEAQERHEAKAAERNEEAREEWLDEQRDLLIQEMGNCPV